MKKDFNITLRNIDGEPILVTKKTKEGEEGEEEIELTYKVRILDALLGTHPKDSSMAGEMKLKLYRLANKIQDDKGEADYSLDELALIKDRCVLFYPALIYGQIYDLLECDNG